MRNVNRRKGKHIAQSIFFFSILKISKEAKKRYFWLTVSCWVFLSFSPKQPSCILRTLGHQPDPHYWTFSWFHWEMESHRRATFPKAELSLNCLSAHMVCLPSSGNRLIICSKLAQPLHLYMCYSTPRQSHFSILQSVSQTLPDFEALQFPWALATEKAPATYKSPCLRLPCCAEASSPGDHSSDTNHIEQIQLQHIPHREGPNPSQVFQPSPAFGVTPTKTDTCGRDQMKFLTHRSVSRNDVPLCH